MASSATYTMSTALNKKTYFGYALSMYRNPSCSGIDEFQDDLARIKYIKRLLHRYTRSGEISGRLLINHIVNAHNVFQAEAIAKMLFFRIQPTAYPALKTTLEFFSLMPDTIDTADGSIVLNTSIATDLNLFQILTETVEGRRGKIR